MLGWTIVAVYKREMRSGASSGRELVIQAVASGA